MPRDLDGRELRRRLSRLGYAQTNQRGSHMRFTCTAPREHHLTIPDHSPLRAGTSAAILRQIAEIHGLSRQELIELICE